MINNAKECAKTSGKYSFGLDANKTAEALRKLADEIELGTVMLHAVSISSHATHEELSVREIVIEVLEESPLGGPHAIKP